MNFLFAIDSLGSGGAQRQMVTLATELTARGHHIEFFVYYPQNHFQAQLDCAGVPVHLHLKSSRFSFAPMVEMRRVLASRYFDCTLAFLDTPNLYAEVAGIGLRGKAKLIVSERSAYPPGKLPLTKRCSQELHRLADAITVNSHSQCARMVQEFPWMAAKLFTIYNGIDLGYFSPGERGGNRSSDRLVLVAVGTTFAYKNMMGLALALKILRERYDLKPVVRWVGKSDRGPARSEVKRFIAANGLQSQWEWLGERSDVPAVLREHDALVHPSFFEGLPNVVCEALACGLPVLAGNVCDHSVLVNEGVSGFLFDPRSPADIARAIYRMHNTSSVERRAMSAAARSYAEANLSAATCADKYEALFRSVAGTSAVLHA